MNINIAYRLNNAKSLDFNNLIQIIMAYSPFLLIIQ